MIGFVQMGRITKGRFELQSVSFYLEQPDGSLTEIRVPGSTRTEIPYFAQLLTILTNTTTILPRLLSSKTADPR